MEKIYIWGAGKLANEILSALEAAMVDYHYNHIFQIKGVIDNDIKKWGSVFHQMKVISPGEAIDNGFDNIVILCEKEEEVREQLKYGYHILQEKIQKRWYLLQLVMILKYENDPNPEIQSILKHWKENSIEIYNKYLPPMEKFHEVIWDKKYNLPYIEFPTIESKMKKMYFPRMRHFEILDGKQIVRDILYEQHPQSPHLYICNNHTVEDGDVILDGGVCEGNFALQYVDVASKIYLVECDPQWAEPIYLTFKDYWDKVVFSNKMLSNRDGYNSISIDQLVDGKLDFMKLDLEGAEISTIQGAKKTLERENVKCSICSYHKNKDEQYIRQFLEQIGYNTNVSNGYMTFWFDRDIWYHRDFRRGIVYAQKKYNYTEKYLC